jgi:hypothetical protein
VASSCEHDHESSGSIKGGEFLDQLSDYQLFKKDSVPWSWLSRKAAVMVAALNHN